MQLNVHSIFESISGEAGFIAQGATTTFIRLQGCNLRCSWCDTVAAQEQKGNHILTPIDDIALQIHTRNVLITGGEPLTQREGLIDLIDALESRGHFVQIETNGSLPLYIHPTKFPGHWVVDYKLPSSKMHLRMMPIHEFAFNLTHTASMVKFVVDIGSDGRDPTDFNAMISAIYLLMKEEYAGDFIVSPLDARPQSLNLLHSMLKIHPQELKDRLIFSLQIHKLCQLA